MERRLPRLVAIAALLLAAGDCAHRSDLHRAATQANYGVEMARMDLWREAMFRFQRAVDSAPGDAMAHNNLAVAYEANGDFEQARKQYLEALRLDRTNSYIQKNYSRYIEFLSRGRKRVPAKGVTAGTKSAGPTAGASGEVISLAPPDRPLGETPAPRPGAPPGSVPSDLPPPNPPTSPPVPPPGSQTPAAGGAR